MNIESIHYSLRNLQHRKGRSFLTVFSILVGIATIFIFISFGQGLYDYTKSFTTESSANKVLIMAKGTSAPGMNDAFRLTEEDLEVVEKTSGVYDATGMYYDVVEVSKKDQNKYVFITSYDPKKPLILDVFNVDVEKGRYLESGDTKVAVLGYNYLVENKIFEKALEINDVIEIKGEKLKVVGFFESVGNPQDDSQIYVTNDYFLELFPSENSYAQIVAEVDLESINKVVSNIEKSLRKHRDLEEGKEDFYVRSFEDFIDSFSGTLDLIVGFVILIALISVLVSGINTANTMITSVLERKKEIGILKAIGARNSEILKIFLFESAFLGFLAGVLGILVGFGLTSLAAFIIESLGWGFLKPSYNAWIFVGCILFATLTGAISGVLPAVRASKTNPVDALRYE